MVQHKMILAGDLFNFGEVDKLRDIVVSCKGDKVQAVKRVESEILTDAVMDRINAKVGGLVERDELASAMCDSMNHIIRSLAETGDCKPFVSAVPVNAVVVNGPVN